MENLSINIQVKADIIMPEVPSVIKLENGTVMKASELSENALKKIAQAWSKEFVAQAVKDSLPASQKAARLNEGE